VTDLYEEEKQEITDEELRKGILPMPKIIEGRSDCKQYIQCITELEKENEELRGRLAKEQPGQYVDMILQQEVEDLRQENERLKGELDAAINERNELREGTEKYSHYSMQRADRYRKALEEIKSLNAITPEECQEVMEIADTALKEGE